MFTKKSKLNSIAMLAITVLFPALFMLVSCRKENTTPINETKNIKGIVRIQDDVNHIGYLTPINGQLSNYLKEDNHLKHFKLNLNQKDLDINAIYINADDFSKVMLDSLKKSLVFNSMLKNNVAIVIDSREGSDNIAAKKLSLELGFGGITSTGTVVLSVKYDSEKGVVRRTTPLFNPRITKLSSLGNSQHNCRSFFYEPTKFTEDEANKIKEEYDEEISFVLPTINSSGNRNYRTRNAPLTKAINDFETGFILNGRNFSRCYEGGEGGQNFRFAADASLRTTDRPKVTDVRMERISEIGRGGGSISVTKGISTSSSLSISWSLGAKAAPDKALGAFGWAIKEIAPSVGGSYTVTRTKIHTSTHSDDIPLPRTNLGAFFEKKWEGDGSGYSCVKTVNFRHWNICSTQLLWFYYDFWDIKDSNGRHIDQKMNYTAKKASVNFGEPWIHDTNFGMDVWGSGR